MALWVEKHSPKSASEVQGQNAAMQQLLAYITTFKKGRAAFLYGPPGNGKTSSVHAIAREKDYELIEVNASDVRDAESIRSKLGNALGQMSLFSKSKIILVDEIDGISGSEDRGGLSEVARLIDSAKFPLIFTANDPFDKKFSTLRNKSELIEFRTLNYLSVQAVLKRIAKAEGIVCDEEGLTAIARRAGGDLRGAINDFQSIAEYPKKLSKEDVDTLYSRRQSDSMINALMRIFKTTNPEVALPALDDVDEDIGDVFLWIEENLPKEYKKEEDLAKAFDTLSVADVFRGRITRRQHWGFLSYINELLTAGIALSKKEKYPGFNKYTRTSRILRMWQLNNKNSKRDAIADKIAAKTHISSKAVIQDTLPYVRIIFKNNKEAAAKLSEYFELEKEETAYLST